MPLFAHCNGGITYPDLAFGPSSHTPAPDHADRLAHDCVRGGTSCTGRDRHRVNAATSALFPK
jgi:hypothetical protein